MSVCLRLCLPIFMCLLLMPQYSFGMKVITGLRPPSHCPSQYFESPPPEKANFKELKQIIRTYGKRAVSESLRVLLDMNVTFRRGNSTFFQSTGYVSLDQVDECSLMYDFLKLDISLSTLEKSIKDTLSLAEQRRKKEAEQRRANIERANRKARLAEEERVAEEERARRSKEASLAAEARLAEQLRLAEESIAADMEQNDEKRLAERKKAEETAKRAEKHSYSGTTSGSSYRTPYNEKRSFSERVQEKRQTDTYIREYMDYAEKQGYR